MTEDLQDRLREKDWAVLRNIQDENDDVQKITEATTLENYHVTYAFQKLAELGLITVSKPEGTVERMIDGQKRVFQHPKQAKLTPDAQEFLNTTQKPSRQSYEDLTHNELVQKVRHLEDKVESLQQALDTFRKQVQERF